MMIRLGNGVNSLRFLSTLPKTVRKIDFLLNYILKCYFQCTHQKEGQGITWENAKPLSAIPGPKKLPIIGIAHNFLPGGKYYKLELVDVHRKMREEYGQIVFLPGALGTKDFVR